MPRTDPAPLGAVLAHLVGPDRRTVKGGTLRGQLYASPEGLVLLRFPTVTRALDIAALGAMLGAVVLAGANLAWWKRMDLLWVAVGLMAVHALTLPTRRKLHAPQPLDAGALAAAVAAGRAALKVPVADVRGLEDPGAGQAGRRSPARVELPQGALELWVDAPTFAEVRRALGRG